MLRLDWETNATLGTYPFIPNAPELIQRNLSTLRHHIRQMDKAVGQLNIQFHEEEARFCIRMHNRLVERNKMIMQRSR